MRAPEGWHRQGEGFLHLGRLEKVVGRARDGVGTSERQLGLVLEFGGLRGFGVFGVFGGGLVFVLGILVGEGRRRPLFGRTKNFQRGRPGTYGIVK
jgi:hypothetical protein